jgi:D-serine deaminase-like pyridoxal phosphate-dependent protein
MQYNWWEINPETRIDTPFLAVYSERMRFNIEKLLAAVGGNVQRLRPHIKTHKIGEVLDLFKAYKIDKIKCATIAEAELSAIHHISDILLAYQPVGLKSHRWIQLIKKYPNTLFSTIVDNYEIAEQLAELAKENSLTLNIYLDINTGMNRTGVSLSDNWEDLATKIAQLPNLNFLGLHIYDGHLKGSLEHRKRDALTTFEQIKNRISVLQQNFDYPLKIVAGGSNTFPFYAEIKDVECSPGTFIFWDVNYQTHLPEQDFKPAAVIVGTVISKPTAKTICIDIGYKSVASESPLDKRLAILNDEKLIPIAHSEEHLVLENKGEEDYPIGTTIYALPYHVCPTCALYESVQVVNEEHNIYDQWMVMARNKKITI